MKKSDDSVSKRHYAALSFFLEQREPHVVVFFKRVFNLGIVAVCAQTLYSLIFRKNFF